LLCIGQCIVHLFSISTVVIIVSVYHVCVNGVPLVLLAPDALGSSTSFVLLAHAARELVPLVLLAPDACGSLALSVLLVPAAGGSFTLVVHFRVFCPSHPATDLASLLPSCLHFLIGVRFMVGWCCRVVVVVCVCLVCCYCCWLLRSVWFLG
jgi:hypothetical protein